MKSPLDMYFFPYLSKKREEVNTNLIIPVGRPWQLHFDLTMPSVKQQKKVKKNISSEFMVQIS